MKFIALLVASLSVQALGANRILENAKLDDRFRCAKNGISQQSCRELQDNALSSHCINSDEYNTLKQRNEAPYCWNNELISWCSCGCFDPRTRVFVEDRMGKSFWERIDTVVQNKEAFKLWSLTEDSSFQPLQTQSLAIRKTTSGPEADPLIYIHTEDGHELGVTQDHAVLCSTGEMLRAKSLQIGQSLVTSDGAFTKIARLEHKTIQDDVVNVLTDSEALKSHIILAEGLAVGDLAWQNSLESELNSIVIRKEG